MFAHGPLLTPELKIDHVIDSECQSHKDLEFNNICLYTHMYVL